VQVVGAWLHGGLADVAQLGLTARQVAQVLVDHRRVVDNVVFSMALQHLREGKQLLRNNEARVKFKLCSFPSCHPIHKKIVVFNKTIVL